eukprot:2498887-Prymnesium_polylepis.1
MVCSNGEAGNVPTMVNETLCAAALAATGRNPNGTELRSAIAAFNSRAVLMIGDSTMENRYDFLRRSGVHEGCQAGSGVCCLRYDANEYCAYSRRDSRGHEKPINGCHDIRLGPPCPFLIVANSTTAPPVLRWKHISRPVDSWDGVIFNGGSLHALGLGGWSTKQENFDDFYEGLKTCAQRMTATFHGSVRIMALSNSICTGAYRGPMADYAKQRMQHREETLYSMQMTEAGANSMQLADREAARLASFRLLDSSTDG